MTYKANLALADFLNDLWNKHSDKFEAIEDAKEIPNYTYANMETWKAIAAGLISGAGLKLQFPGAVVIESDGLVCHAWDEMKKLVNTVSGPTYGTLIFIPNDTKEGE